MRPKRLTTGRSGPPRVGKTLTAEAVGELLHRPLYYVCDFPHCLLLLCPSRRFLLVSSTSKQKPSKTACPVSFHWHIIGMPGFFWMKQKCTWSNESGRTSSSEVDRGSSFVRNRPHNEYDTGSAETDNLQRANQTEAVVNTNVSDEPPLSIAESSGQTLALATVSASSTTIHHNALSS